ncbi:type IV secretion system protein [Phenylobacterium sp. LjRoot219]|uniref:type IV secretion system protein n=1 Tax=Phenylobacterium sp. LjRoot219 TaxID=3342283 RepID=UPI003ECF618B
MKARPIVLAATLALLTDAAPAHAQLAVYDASSYAKLLQQAETALGQLDQLKRQVQQGQRLTDSLNTNSNVNAIAAQLSTPQLRQFLPDITRFMAADQSRDFGGLGAMGDRARQIRAAERIYTPAHSPTDGYATEALERSGDRIARDMALGESVSAVGAQRLQGLEELRQSLDTATDARAVFDIQARIAAENALIQNDQMRLQGMAMVQQAQERAQAQRDREEVMRASQERLQLYRQGFQ